MESNDIEQRLTRAILDAQMNKKTMAHEWGHVLYLNKIHVAPLFMAVVCYNNKTAGSVKYDRATFRNISSEDAAILFYCGPVAESLYTGRRVQISYTDRESVQTLTKAQKARARKQATEFLAPKIGTIKKLVAETQNHIIHRGPGPVDFSLMLIPNEIRKQLKDVGEQVNF